MYFSIKSAEGQAGRAAILVASCEIYLKIFLAGALSVSSHDAKNAI
jgi:hypothetical protein